MKTDLYRNLVEGIDEGALQKALGEMVAIKSENPFDSEPRPGYREKEMGEYLAQCLTELGMDVAVREIAPGRPNVFGRRKGESGGASLMLAGHMDTARSDGYTDAYRVEVREGRLHGRGSCDMKAGLAAYLEVARVLKEAGVKLTGDLLIAGIADEEYQMLGSRDVGANGPWADQGIIGEPTMMTVCPANKGRVSTFIRTFGKASHSSVPEEGENAIERMAAVIGALRGYNHDLLQGPEHPLCGHGRFNQGVIRGGVQVNMVPDLCELEIDRRTLPGETKEQVYLELAERIEPLEQDDPGFRYEITEPSWLIPPNDISPIEPVVISLLSAYREVFGRPTEVTAFVAGSDAPHMGFPTVVCGPGSIAQAHSTCEFVETEQLVLAARMYLWSVVDLLA